MSLVLAGLSMSVSVLAACSGAGNQDLFEETSEQNDTSATQPAPSTPSPGTPDTDAPTLPPPSAKDGGTPAPPPPDDTCTTEQEPNNDVAHATPFTGGLCGKLGTSSDIDYGSFVAPPNAKTISWAHAESGGKVAYRFFVGGLQVAGTEDDELRAIPGATYTVQIRAGSGNGGNRPSYELTVSAK